MLRDVAMPEMAVIGRSKDSQAVASFVADAYVAFGKFAARAARGSQVVPRLTDGPPLAAGATVRWMDGAWIEASTGESIRFDGGFEPHFAQIADLVILSTSPDLTRRILALRAGSASHPLTLPPTKEPLVAWSRVPCAPFAKQVGDALMASERMFGPLVFHPEGPVRTPEDAARLFEMACILMSDVTQVTTQRAGERIIRYDLAAPPDLYRR